MSVAPLWASPFTHCLDLKWPSGQIGMFNFQALLLSITSSLALLALAKSLVNCGAFYLLPLRFIYRQYRTIDVRMALVVCSTHPWLSAHTAWPHGQTVDFSDLTDADVAAFKKHDLINHHPSIGVAKGAPSAKAPSLQHDHFDSASAPSAAGESGCR